MTENAASQWQEIHMNRNLSNLQPEDDGLDPVCRVRGANVVTGGCFGALVQLWGTNLLPCLHQIVAFCFFDFVLWWSETANPGVFQLEADVNNMLEF